MLNVSHCMFYKVVAVGFYTLYYGAERRGIKASARIQKGEFVVITGKSGSGKSTLGSVINGLISHYYDGVLTGEAYLNGKDIRTMELSQIGCMVGCVFQDPRSQFFMTDPFSETAFGCSNMLLNREEILKRVDNSLKLLGINHLKEKRAPLKTRLDF